MQKTNTAHLTITVFILVIVTIIMSCTVQEDTKNPLKNQAPRSMADLVLHQGEIYTVNPSQPWAEAVAIQSGYIVFVGSDADVEAFISEDTEVIDLEGAMVMPGFQDPHLHAIEAGVNQSFCVFPAEASIAEYKRILKKCAEQQQDQDWILGSGVSTASLLEWEDLPIDTIDEVIPEKPVLILDDLGHGAWANTVAMAAVGYDTLQDNPNGGIIDRDPDTGELTGLVFENAQQPLRTAAAPPTVKNLDFAYQGLLVSLEVLAENGITTVSDAGGYWPQGHPEVWQRAINEGTLTVRASNALYVYPDLPFEQQVADLKRHYRNDVTSLVRFNQVKIYVDGILGQGTGALYAPYEIPFGLPGVSDTGFLYFEPNLLNRYAQRLEAEGFQLHFHATGDRGAGLALDAVEYAFRQNELSDKRHRITHLFLVDPADQPRFADLGVIADFQLAPGSIDLIYIDDIAELIGDRADAFLPVRSVLETGATVVLSSDWDADDLSPFVKIHAVLTREFEAVPNLETALRMMTLDVAHLLHHENQTGSIEVGKFADLIVLDQNLFNVSTAQIPDTIVLLTLLGGEVVYEDSNF